jgi:hypothetical protein
MEIEVKAFRTVIRVYTYTFTTWEFVADTDILKLQRLRNKLLCAIGYISKLDISPRVAHGYTSTVYSYLWLHNEIVQETNRGHTKSWEYKCS